MSGSAQEEFSRAKALEAAGDYAGAEPIYDRLKSDPVQSLRSRRRRAECLKRLQRWPEAAQEVAAVFAADPNPGNSDFKRWLAIRAQLGDAARPADAVTDHVRAARANGDYPDGPYIVFTAAAPKTGSTSLSVALAGALGAARLNVLDLPPTSRDWGRPWWPAVDALQGCAVVNHCHLSPDADTLAQITARPWVKAAVHLRNPLEAIESTIDMVLRMRSPNLLSGHPKMAHAPDEALRVWVLDHYLPQLAGWMGDWLAIADAGHPNVLGLTTMDDMRARGQNALARDLVADLPGLTPQQVETDPQRTGQRLKGDKAVRLTGAEADQVRAAMPPGLMDRFGWA